MRLSRAVADFLTGSLMHTILYPCRVYGKRKGAVVSDVDRGHLHVHPAPTANGSEVKDVVCGMSVDPAKAPQRATHGGVDYFFCGARCREKFVSDPGRYLVS